MKKQWILISAALLLLSFALAVNLSLAQGPGPGGERNPQDALGTAFTYQGQLQRGGSPVDGPCDVAFRLYDAASAGNQVGSAISATVPITGGLFTVGLDFGAAAFDGDGRWLDIRVKCDGDGDYADLGRQELTATPYAHYALHAPWSGLSNVPPGFADGVDNMSVVVSSTNVFVGEGLDQLSAGDSITLSLLSTYQLPQACANGAIAEWNSGTSLWQCGVDDQGSGGGAAWLLDGNAGSDPATNFVGTSDELSLTLAVSSTTALRLEPSGGTPNLIGGYSGNSVTAGVRGANIGGGGAGSSPNQVTADYGAIGGGIGNRATGDSATVAGGWGNEASGYWSAVGGGVGNVVTGSHAIIAGGWGNNVTGDYATVSGGLNNDASGESATIGGGNQNVVTAAHATVGGGRYNAIRASSSVICGGSSNLVTGTFSVIGGGFNNRVMASLATIAGGGGLDPFDPNIRNRVTDNLGVVSGGAGNHAGNGDDDQTNATYATIGGGLENNASSDYATVGGGEHNTASGSGATIGGGKSNVVTATYATVGGGLSNDATATYATVGGGLLNNATGSDATIAGGSENYATNWAATVGGGWWNFAVGDAATVGGGQANDAYGNSATIAGGYNNGASGDYATIAGGRHNRAVITATAAAIGGGYNNRVTAPYATVAGGGSDDSDYGNRATDDYSTVGGGYDNLAGNNTGTTADANYATVGGGRSNEASNNYATVGGGWDNQATGWAATVPGGLSNEASGDYSFAAGRRAKANNLGCFVWNDSSTNADVNCSVDFRWVARSSGGVYFYTNSGLSSGMYLAASGSAWNAVSDRERKENLEPVDVQNLLARLAEIPIHTWNYKAQDPTIRHIGLMADEFNALVEGLGGEGEDYINTLDADGVALAAIQGLIAENAALREQLGDMETRLSALEAESASSASPWQRGLLPGAGLLLTGLVWVTRREGITIKLSRGGGQ